MSSTACCGRSILRSASRTEPDPRSAGSISMDQSLRRLGGTPPEPALHEYAVKPAVELEAHIVQRAAHAKAGPAVQLDRSRIGRIPDHRDHLAEAARLAGGDQVAQ